VEDRRPPGTPAPVHLPRMESSACRFGTLALVSAVQASARSQCHECIRLRLYGRTLGIAQIRAPRFGAIAGLPARCRRARRDLCFFVRSTGAALLCFRVQPAAPTGLPAPSSPLVHPPRSTRCSAAPPDQGRAGSRDCVGKSAVGDSNREPCISVRSCMRVALWRAWWIVLDGFGLTLPALVAWWLTYAEGVARCRQGFPGVT
jgi:hypothetical protein